MNRRRQKIRKPKRWKMFDQQREYLEQVYLGRLPSEKSAVNHFKTTGSRGYGLFPSIRVVSLCPGGKRETMLVFCQARTICGPLVRIEKAERRESLLGTKV